MKERQIVYLIFIFLISFIFIIMCAFILVLLSIMPKPTPPLEETLPPPSPIYIVPPPSPTYIVPTPFPTPFIPDKLMNGDGGSELRTIVNEGGSLESIFEPLQKYEWVTGDLDESRATALYLYDKAWVSTTYTEDYVHNINLAKDFLHYGLVSTVFMNSNSPDGFCGIRTNANSNGDYIDVLLYRNGQLRTIVVAGGKIIKDESNLVYSPTENIQTDGRAFAVVYMFYDQPGLTVIVNYLVLGAETSPSRRIRIDFDPLVLLPEQGPLMLRAGTNYGNTTYCSYGDFYQYPIRH